jgi:hypothetical protein
MRVTVSSNIDEVLGWTARLHPQWQFAVAKALTDTVRDIQRELPAEVERTFEGGAVEFTKRGWYIKPARKDTLQAEVGAKDKQAQYLAYQVEGGRRAPTRVALRLPSVVDLTAQGNLPTGTIRRLVAAARSGRRIRGATARKAGIANGSEVFYGQPRGRPDMPPGLYSRRNVAGHRTLVPIVVFPRQDARYERRFAFHAFAERVAGRVFDANLSRAWDLALRTASK